MDKSILSRFNDLWPPVTKELEAGRVCRRFWPDAPGVRHDWHKAIKAAIQSGELPARLEEGKPGQTVWKQRRRPWVTDWGAQRPEFTPAEVPGTPDRYFLDRASFRLWLVKQFGESEISSPALEESRNVSAIRDLARKLEAGIYDGGGENSPARGREILSVADVAARIQPDHGNRQKIVSLLMAAVSQGRKEYSEYMQTLGRMGYHDRQKYPFGPEEGLIAEPQDAEDDSGLVFLPNPGGPEHDTWIGKESLGGWASRIGTPLFDGLLRQSWDEEWEAGGANDDRLAEKAACELTRNERRAFTLQEPERDRDSAQLVYKTARVLYEESGRMPEGSEVYAYLLGDGNKSNDKTGLVSHIKGRVIHLKNGTTLDAEKIKRAFKRMSKSGNNDK